MNKVSKEKYLQRKWKHFIESQNGILNLEEKNDSKWADHMMQRTAEMTAQLTVFNNWALGGMEYQNHLKTFTTLYYYYMGIRRVHASRQRIRLTESIVNLCLDKPETIIVKPEMPNGQIFIECNFTFQVKRKGRENSDIMGILITDHAVTPRSNQPELDETLLIPMEHENGYLVQVVDEDHTPWVGIEVPVECNIFEFIATSDIVRDSSIGEAPLIMMIIALTALQKIQRGEFEKKNSVEPLPFIKATGKRKTKKRRIKRSKPSVNRITTYYHESSEEATPVKTSPQNDPIQTEGTEDEPRSFTYTPRNTSSHFKRRWVTLEYAETLPDEDIIDIQPITKNLKNGQVTKDMALVKVWFTFTHNPALEPATRVDQYKA